MPGQQMLALSDLTGALHSSRNFDEVVQIADAFVERLGGAGISIGVLQSADFGLLGYSTTMAPDFMDHYANQNYHEVDPFLAHFRKSDDAATLGFEKDFEFSKKYNTGATLYDDLRSAGYHNLFFQPVRSTDQALSSCVGFTYGSDYEEAEQFLSSHVELLTLACHMIGLTATQRFRSSALPQNWRQTNASKLAPRELEAVQWLSTGLRTDEIAHRMNIQPVTVNLHLKNAKKAMKAKTREHLISLAFLQNLL